MATRRLIIEAIAVVAFAVACWALIYSPILTGCCGSLDGPVIFVLWTAAMIGALFTGAGSSPGRLEVLVGFVMEGLAVWAIVRIAMLGLLRKRGTG